MCKSIEILPLSHTWLFQPEHAPSEEDISSPVPFPYTSLASLAVSACGEVHGIAFKEVPRSSAARDTHVLTSVGGLSLEERVGMGDVRSLFAKKTCAHMRVLWQEEEPRRKKKTSRRLKEEVPLLSSRPSGLHGEQTKPAKKPGNDVSLSLQEGMGRYSNFAVPSLSFLWKSGDLVIQTRCVGEENKGKGNPSPEEKDTEPIQPKPPRSPLSPSLSRPLPLSASSEDRPCLFLPFHGPPPLSTTSFPSIPPPASPPIYAKYFPFLFSSDVQDLRVPHAPNVRLFSRIVRKAIFFLVVQDLLFPERQMVVRTFVFEQLVRGELSEPTFRPSLGTRVRALLRRHKDPKHRRNTPAAPQTSQAPPTPPPPPPPALTNELSNFPYCPFSYAAFVRQTQATFVSSLLSDLVRVWDGFAASLASPSSPPAVLSPLVDISERQHWHQIWVHLEPLYRGYLAPPPRGMATTKNSHPLSLCVDLFPVPFFEDEARKSKTDPYARLSRALRRAFASLKSRQQEDTRSSSNVKKKRLRYSRETYGPSPSWSARPTSSSTVKFESVFPSILALPKGAFAEVSVHLHRSQFVKEYDVAVSLFDMPNGSSRRSLPLPSPLPSPGPSDAPLGDTVPCLQPHRLPTSLFVRKSFYLPGHPRYQKDKGFDVDDVLNEILLLSHLQFPTIVTYLGSFYHGSTISLCMEAAAGPSLREVISAYKQRAHSAFHRLRAKEQAPQREPPVRVCARPSPGSSPSGHTEGRTSEEEEVSCLSQSFSSSSPEELSGSRVFLQNTQTKESSTHTSPPDPCVPVSVTSSLPSQRFLETFLVLSEQQVAAIAVDVLASLLYCGSKSIVHRDLKPDNLVFRGPVLPPPASDRPTQPPFPDLLLCDFGLAFRGRRTGHFAGSNLYLAPEAAACESRVKYGLLRRWQQQEENNLTPAPVGENTTPARKSEIHVDLPEACEQALRHCLVQNRGYDQKADVWGLGCILFECLFGTSPSRFSFHPNLALDKQYDPLLTSREIRDRILQNRLRWEEVEHRWREGSLSTRCREFLHSALQYDTRLRGTAHSLFFHPWLKEKQPERHRQRYMQLCLELGTTRLSSACSSL